MTHDTDNHDEGSEKAAGYEVGYGKPPVHSRFRKGQSGNRAGRTKGVKNAMTVMAQALAERVTVIDGGKRKSITKFEAAAKQLANKAVKGDAKSIKLVMEIAREYDEQRPPAEAQKSKHDFKMRVDLIRRIRRSQENIHESD